MKKLVITLFVVLGTAYWLFGQCNLPRVGVGVGLSTLDTVALPSFVTPCPTCQAGGKYAWELDSAFRGMISLTSNLQSDVTVRISQDCHEVVFDTCISLPQMGNAELAFYKEYVSFGYCQVHVFGLPGQIVAIEANSVPTIGNPTFDVIMDMDTCGTLLSTEPAREITQVIYKRLDNGLIYTTPLPAGMYVVETLFPAGRKKLILVE